MLANRECHMKRLGSTMIPILAAASIISMFGCGTSPDDARKELTEIGITYNKTEFIRCVQENDIRAVELFLIAGMPTDFEYQDPRTGKSGYVSTFSYAAQSGHKEIVEMMIQKGAKVKPVLDILSEVDPSAVLLIVQSGADLSSIPAQSTLSYLNSALYAEDIDLAKALLAAGVSPKLENGDNPDDYPLFHAVSLKDVDLVLTLIKAGADVNPGSNLEDTESIWFTPLFQAVSTGQIEMVELLLDHGADPELGRYRPLTEAAEQRNLDIVELLLDRGADINGGAMNTSNGEGMALLGVAIIVGDDEMFQWVIEKGADVTTGESGAVAIAAKEGQLEMAKRLVAEGADLTANDSIALKEAAYYGHIEMVEWLIAHGADMNSSNALARASANNHIEVMQLLMKEGADVNNALSEITKHTTADTVEMLIQLGADVNTADLIDLLVIPGEYSSQNVLSLINSGAGVNRSDTVFFLSQHELPYLDGQSYRSDVKVTLLEAAVRVKNYDIAELILAKSPNQSTLDRSLHWAIWAGDSHMVSVLISNGANPNAELSLKGEKVLHPIVRALAVHPSHVKLERRKENNFFFTNYDKVFGLITKNLIDAGANVDDLTPDQKSQLDRLLFRGRM